MPQKIELLSPAKNLELGKAAINCGADAVYIGASKFGARSAAVNSLAEIEMLVKYAHRYFAKTYVTLNTLLFDNELDEALKLIYQLWSAGVDALIIQDMGLLELDLPPIPIFASTQTNNTTWQKVEFLENVGVQRVILARELSIEQIAEIRKHTKVDLESFIHGAICVCYSGQCYLSQELTGRSGNRGECAQPCRWDFTLRDSKGKTLKQNQHLLSIKDLNLTNHLESLIDAGISSFKIEGRLKDIAYVKNVTGWYRQRLDSIIEKQDGKTIKASSGKTIFNFDPDPERTFNRGYTDYFINSKKQEMASFATQKSIGKFIGVVQKVEGKKLVIDTSEIILNGDGFCFIDEDGILKGFKVNIAQGNHIYPNEMPILDKGTKLFRNHDQKFEQLLEKQDTERKIDIHFFLAETQDGLKLSATDEDGVEVSVECYIEKEKANNEVKAKESIIQALSKTGNTIFSVVNIELDFSNLLFIKTLVLNDLRRKCNDLLETKRNSLCERNTFSIEKNNFPYPEKHLDYRANILNQKAVEFYKRHGVITIEMGFESSSSNANKTLMTTRYCLKYELKECPIFQTGTGVNKEKTLLLESGNNSLLLEFDCKNCEMIVKKR
jgi:putative protease